MCWVLSWKLKGLCLITGSGVRQVLRLIEIATAPSSTYLIFSDFDLVIGPIVFLGIGGLMKAPLYLIIKIRPPRNAP